MRFPEFTGEWETTTIGECCGALEYGMNAPAKPYDGQNKYIRITDIDETSSTYRQDDIVSPNGILEDRYRVKVNDILFARTGASTGKTYLYNESDGRLYFAGFLIRANVKPNFNAKFVFIQTQTQQYKRWVDIMSIRSGQPGVNSQEYSGYRFGIAPSKEEQDKIAVLFNLLDERISTQSKIIDKLQSLMSGICERILYFDTGENVKLGDILSERVEKTTANNQYKILSSTVKGIYRQREYFSKDIASENNIGYKVVRLNDIVLSPQNLWMGNINFNDKFRSISSCNQGLITPFSSSDCSVIHCS